MHAKLRVHKTVTVGANLHRLIYNLLIAIVFLTYFTSGLKIDQSRKTALKTIISDIHSEV